MGNVSQGSVIEYDVGTDEYSISFDEGLVNLNGFSILPNGNYLLTTTSTQSLPGLASFTDGDIVEWNPNTNLASLFLDEADIFTSDANDGVHALHAVSATEVLFSPSTASGGTIGSNNVAYNQDSADLFRIDKDTGVASRVLDGEDLWDSGNTRQTDAAFVSVPQEAVPCPCWDAALLATEIANVDTCSTTSSPSASESMTTGTDAAGCFARARTSFRFNPGDGSPRNGWCKADATDFDSTAMPCVRSVGTGLVRITVEEFETCQALVEAHCP
ncbi:MAG: hypothetical protein QNK04_09930 [Myxococcota bacterium]|nr:hypothetical protein [Myxococcota bacterium]